MNKREKRYVVQMEMYVYADNDHMARKRSHELAEEINNNNRHDPRAMITSLGEQPFASFNFRKLEDHSKPISSKIKDELPF